MPVEHEADDQDDNADDRRHRHDLEDPATADPGERIGKARQHDAGGQHQREAAKHQIHRQRRDEVRHPELGDDEAIHEAARQADQDGHGHGDIDVEAHILDQHRHDHGGQRGDRADREVDAAAGDDQRHAHGQDHEDRRILEDDHDVLDAEETRVGDRHDQAKCHNHDQRAKNIDVALEPGDFPPPRRSDKSSACDGRHASPALFFFLHCGTSLWHSTEMPSR